VRSRAFLSLYASLFVATMGISMVGPLLPVFARDLGASGVWLGLTFSAFAVAQAFVGPFAGRWSDRYGRKPFIVAGLLIYFVAALGYLTAGSFYQVIAFRAFTGLGTSLIFSVSRAYVGDMTPPGQEGRWFGVYATADFIGFGTGPVVAGILREVLGFRSVFVAMALMMAAAAVIVAMALPKTPPVTWDRRGVAVRAPSVGLLHALKDRLALAMTLHMTLQALAGGATFAFLGLRLENDLGATPFMVGIAFATQDVTGGVAQPLWGRIADRANRRAMVAIGLAWNGILLVALGYAPSYSLAFCALFAAGAGGAAAMVASSAIQVVAGRRVGMGTLLGLGAAGNGFGMVTGSVVGGLLADSFTLSTAFLFGGIVTVAGTGLFLALTRGLATSEPTATAAIPVAPEPAAPG